MWTKVSLDLIRIQTIWHYDGISERIILRLFILKNATHKKLAQLPFTAVSGFIQLAYICVVGGHKPSEFFCEFCMTEFDDDGRDQ